MKLTIPERVSLLNVLPPMGDIVMLRIVQDLRMRLSFSEGELKKYKIKVEKQPDGGAFITWDEDYANMTKDIEIGDVAKDIIRREFARLNEQRKLHFTMLPLYDKFVDGKETESSKRGDKKRATKKKE